MTTTTIKISRLLSPYTFNVTIENNTLKVTAENKLSASGTFTLQGDALYLNVTADLQELIDAGVECLFGTHMTCSKIIIDQKIEILREEFFQNPIHWTLKKDESFETEPMIQTKDVTHPLRPRLPDGIFYKKYIPQMNSTLSLRLITEDDLDDFHEWHNQPRVLHFWELNKPKEELRDYIKNGLKDPHQFPVIVEVDGEKLGYFEFYWVKEDRLGPYYDSEDYDRGFHFLVGNTKFLGFTNTDALLKHVLHFLFLDDARTKRVMAEPRHDNQKVLKYAEAAIGWKKLKEFDFPHKRAALLENSRNVFFKGHVL
jgi:acetyl CoA:N6-hydroxylysine acetyl transferase